MVSLAFSLILALASLRPRRVTAELRRRRVAVRSAAGEARLPRRYNVGRLQQMSKVFHGESTLPTGVPESRRGSRSAQARFWAARVDQMGVTK
jgi:hypothetical protein